jgi:type IV pilus assembly protein PilA
MASWYYVDQGNQRTGPVPAEALAEAFRQGRVGIDSLVWRDGMAEWAPLSAHLDELGLDNVRPAVAAAVPGAPPAKSNRGCLIAAAIIVGGGIFLIFILAILAAIALPAYQDYMMRAKLTQALAEAQPAKIAMSEFIANTDRCPRDAAELGLAPPAGGTVASIEAGSLEDGTCAMELTLAPGTAPATLSGAVILLTLADDGHWTCSSDDVRESNLPASCR